MRVTTGTRHIGSYCPRCGKPAGNASSDKWCPACVDTRAYLRTLAMQDNPHISPYAPRDVFDKYIPAACEKRGIPVPYGFTQEGAH